MGTKIFHAADEPVAARQEYCQHAMHELLTPIDVRFPNHDFDARIEASPVGAAEVLDVTLPAGDGFRTPQLIRRSDPEHCKLDIQVRGHLMLEQNDRQTILQPGRFAFVDMSRPCHWSCSSDIRFVALIFPRALLPIPESDIAEAAALAISTNQGVGALVSPLILQLARQGASCDGLDGTRAAAALLDLVAMAVATRLDRTDAVPVDSRRQALLACILGFIERELPNPELSPAAIAAAHHISLRNLYTLFESQQSGVSDWIRRRRLDRCRHDLLDPTMRDQPVSWIGARWGFSSPAHFARAFRTTFGTSPTEFRALQAAQSQSALADRSDP
ncbi:helix-turn-helix domain-containing protein [Nocardia iowensis]|uniref:Helix-turn-helix domain-containing protein n=1 Tax=Nocardia iowensis TaxID=204891 RepID=A0ABX8RTY0_NOCIO|nr:helix-turn-helix domain-containing protein [Nocardia iowensis]QXN93100.1 helix-turn-helix domain-containing protein [Nocardia iowensis]